MKSPVRSSRFIRVICSLLIAVISFQVSPLPVLASTRATEPAPATKHQLASALANVEADLALLLREGKEAYLDSLFARLTADEARLKDNLKQAVHRIGARKLCMLIVGLGSPVLAAILAVIPEPWQEAALLAALNRFITKTMRQLKEILSGLSPKVLAVGLKAVVRLLKNPDSAANAIDGSAPGQAWWERFFGNSTVVRNFIVTIVSLSAIGVAVGLAIAGSTAAPVVAVIGALVALIGLVTGGRLIP